MGLLDLFNSDDGRLGIGLLAAAGPRADGAGFGQRLQEAMTGFASQKDADMKRKFMQSQMDNYASEIEQRKAAIAKQQLLQDMTKRLLGGQQPAQGGTALVNDALPPELRIGAQAPIPARGGLAAASLDDITALHALGGPDLLNAYKYAQEGTERKPGSEYILPNGQRRMGPPALDKGMQLMPQPGGGYSAGLVPGVLDATNALVAGNAAATEGAKAGFDLVSVPDGAGGTIQMPRSMAVQRFGQPNQANNPLRPSGPPLGMGGGNPSPQDLAVIQDDLQRNGVDRTDPRAPFVNFGQAGGSQLGRTPSAADLEVDKQRKLAPGVAAAASDAARAKATADAQVQAVEASYTKAKSAADALSAFAESRKAIAGGVYAGAGAETKLAIAKGLQAVGVNAVDPDKVTNTDYLTSTLGAQLLANAKALGSNPTESEGKQLRAILGTIGKDPQALNRVIDWQEGIARRSIEQHNSLLDSAQQRGFTPGYEMRVEPPKAEPPKAKTATLADIAATAKASGRSTAEVTRRLKEKGYSIVGGQP